MTTYGSLCSGYGGLDMAAQTVFGGELSWWSDIAPGAIAVMQRRSPSVPNLGDVRAINWASVPPVDIFTAGYPCQPFSNAGRHLGTDDPRHIWPWIAIGIEQLRPTIVVLENVAAHLRRGFHEVLTDLASLGFDAEWAIVRASDVGAPHRRERLFVVAADANTPRLFGEARGATNTDGSSVYVGVPGELVEWGRYREPIDTWTRVLRRPAPPPVVDDRANARFIEWSMGVPEGWITDTPGISRAEMIELAGNGVVPQQAEFAIRALWSRLISSGDRGTP